MYLKKILCSFLLINCYSVYAVICNEENSGKEQITNKFVNLNDITHALNIPSKKTVFKGSYTEIKQQLIDSQEIITSMKLYLEEASNFP